VPRKLIEVALPLDAINQQSAREKSIRKGHPSTLHLWWSRKPTATSRAVLFSQLVDDPSERYEEFLEAARAAGEAGGAGWRVDWMLMRASWMVLRRARRLPAAHRGDGLDFLRRC